MKVVFTENVKGVASRGDVKNVKNGFYRNFLLPFGKAVVASDGVLKSWEDKRSKMAIEHQELVNQLAETQRRLDGSRVKIAKKVTKKGTLYGGIKAQDIVTAVKEQLNLEIPLDSIVMDDSMKAVGVYEVTLELGAGVSTKLPLEVVEKKA